MLILYQKMTPQVSFSQNSPTDVLSDVPEKKINRLALQPQRFAGGAVTGTCALCDVFRYPTALSTGMALAISSWLTFTMTVAVIY
jgi:hypothetical protein